MITEEIIKKIQSLGFDFWMRPSYPSWLFYAQGDSIGYCLRYEAQTKK